MAYRVFRQTQEAQRVEKKYLTQYETKVRELHGMVIGGAKEAEAIRLKKDGILLEVKETLNKKTELTARINELENQVQEAKKQRENEVAARFSFIEATRKEFKDKTNVLERKKIELEEEIKQSYDRVNKEIGKRLDITYALQDEAKKRLEQLEEKIAATEQRNKELKENVVATQDELEAELERKTISGKALQQTIDKEINKLNQQKNDLQFKISELGKKIHSANIIITTDVDVKRFQQEAENKKQEISNELKSLEQQTDQLLKQKNRIEKETEETKKRIAQEIKKEEEQAKELKNINKNTLKIFEEKRQRLLDKQRKLEHDIRSAQQVLEDEKERRLGFISSSTKELVREQEKAKEAKENITRFEKKIEELANVAKELHAFGEKERYARERYLEVKGKFEGDQRENERLLKESEQLKQEAQKENEQLDHYKEYLKDLSNRLTTTMSYVKEMTEMMNERLENENYPVRFIVPEGQIIKIPF